MREVDWVWPLVLARGKVTIISGDPGLGKSQVAVYAAARISRGEPWLGGSEQAPQGNVIILTAEDAIDDTARPRLEIIGADVERIHVLKMVINREGKRRAFSLRSDLDMLRRQVEAIGDVVLVIIDPISAYMGDKLDSHMMTAVNSVMSVVADFALSANVAVLAIHHPPKEVTEESDPRVLGIAGIRRRAALGVHCRRRPGRPGPQVAAGGEEQSRTESSRARLSHCRGNGRPPLQDLVGAMGPAAGDGNRQRSPARRQRRRILETAAGERNAVGSVARRRAPERRSV